VFGNKGKIQLGNAKKNFGADDLKFLYLLTDRKL
jgi:hypothetical protein